MERTNCWIGDKNRSSHPMLHPVHFTVAQLQVILSAGETKVREWINSGRLASYRIDGTIYVDETAVLDFVLNQRAAAPSFALKGGK